MIYFDVIYDFMNFLSSGLLQCIRYREMIATLGLGATPEWGV